MIGWERIERDWLFAFLTDTARPWPKHAVLAWLRYAHNARKRGVQIQTPTREGGWVLRGALLSGRDLAEAVGLTYKVTRALMESPAWNDFTDERAEAEPARAQTGRSEGAARAQAGRSEGASSDEKSTPKADRPTAKGRSEGARRAQEGRKKGASRALARAFPLTPTETLTPTQTGEAAPDLVPSPPPAEPSGSPADLWSKAADLADPEAWRASEEFQLSTNAYVFDDAEPVGASEQPSDPRQIESPATRAPEAPPQGPRPSPTHPPGNGEGAPGGATAPQSAPSLFGRTDTAPEAQTPAKAPPRAGKASPPPVDLTSPDDPCPLLLGAKVSIGDLTEGIVAVYRSWWRRQPSPATCKITVGRVKLIRQALAGGCSVEQLVHLVRYAYEAADIGTFQRAWRGENGKTPPDLEMLLRGDKFERNVEISGRWSVERIGESFGPLPENVHSFPVPPPRPTRRDFQADRFAILQEMIMENQRNAQL